MYCWWMFQKHSCWMIFLSKSIGIFWSCMFFVIRWWSDWSHTYNRWRWWFFMEQKHPKMMMCGFLTKYNMCPYICFEIYVSMFCIFADWFVSKKTWGNAFPDSVDKPATTNKSGRHLRFFLPLSHIYIPNNTKESPTYSYHNNKLYILFTHMHTWIICVGMCLWPNLLTSNAKKKTNNKHSCKHGW